MDKKKYTLIIGFFVVSILATLFHFLFDHTNFEPFKLIAPINESVWEHSKILVFPFLIFMMFYYFIFKPERKAFWCSVFIACIVMPAYMIIIFYTYTGIIGKSILVIDILLAFVCIAIGFKTFYNNYNNPKFNCKITTALFVIMLVCFIIFTFAAPNLPLFISPV